MDVNQAIEFTRENEKIIRERNQKMKAYHEVIVAAVGDYRNNNARFNELKRRLLSCNAFKEIFVAHKRVEYKDEPYFFEGVQPSFADIERTSRGNNPMVTKVKKCVEEFRLDEDIIHILLNMNDKKAVTQKLVNEVLMKEYNSIECEELLKDDPFLDRLMKRVAVCMQETNTKFNNPIKLLVYNDKFDGYLRMAIDYKCCGVEEMNTLRREIGEYHNGRYILSKLDAFLLSWYLAKLCKLKSGNVKTDLVREFEVGKEREEFEERTIYFDKRIKGFIAVITKKR